MRGGERDVYTTAGELRAISVQILRWSFDNVLHVHVVVFVSCGVCFVIVFEWTRGRDSLTSVDSAGDPVSVTRCASG